ncbi:MAG: hypothetical protein JOZ72_11000 [Alphaproteobacteria bacterium]|nr:hypothetical protein [Alphaproteobacteria bacterium]
MDDDAMWAEALLKDLPGVPAPAALERRILADFDRVAARRRGWFASLSGMVWPGAPAWQPAAVLAAALVVGIVAGSAVPLEDTTEQAATIALDAPPSFDLGEAS